MKNKFLYKKWIFIYSPALIPIWWINSDFMWRRDLHRFTGINILFLFFIGTARRYGADSDEGKNFINTDEYGNKFSEAN